MYKVHCMNNIAKAGTDALGEGFELTDDMSLADAIMVRSAPLHDTQFPEQLKAIARAGAGVNNIPLERCAKEGIVVFNTPGANANAVKELVIGAMLVSARNIYGAITWTRENAADPDIAKSAEKAKKAYVGHELQGKTLGVIGLGAIGILVANAACGLGMNVMGYDPFVSIRGALNLNPKVKWVQTLDELYRAADFITIHVGASESTNGMIDKDGIMKMKDGVVFINFARDLLVDEEAMAKACESGHVARYITDFANPVSVRMKNVIITPHLGASTEEAEENCAVMAANELKDYIENGNINNSVNFPRADLGSKGAGARISLFHMNRPSMIGKITAVIADLGLNIDNMTDKSKGDYAYSLIELTETSIGGDAAEKLTSIDGVYKVRLIC